MTYIQGESIPLYSVFKIQDHIVPVELPKVRVLHEENDKVYEDLTWHAMTAFDDGFIYTLDSNICEYLGEYTVVYEAIYNDQKIHNIETFTLTIPNEVSSQSLNNIKLYGFIDDLNSHKLLEKVKVSVKNVINNNIIATTYSDYSGRWECYVFPGELEFQFQLDGFETKTIRAQVGDSNEEVQFNNISLENNTDMTLGKGQFNIEDVFSDKTGKGIDGVVLEVYSSLDNALLLTTTTDNKGQWHVFLDAGSYMLKAILPSGLERLFRMNIDSQGIKNITAYSKSDSVSSEYLNTTIGEKSINDFIKDAHGTGLSNVHITIWQNNLMIGETYTRIDGSFTLNLDPGIYKMVCSKEGFKEYTLELKI